MENIDACFGKFKELKDEINRSNPAEILIPENLLDDTDLNSIISQNQSIVLTPLDTYYSSYEETYKLLTSHFGTLSLDGFGMHRGHRCQLQAFQIGHGFNRFSGMKIIQADIENKQYFDLAVFGILEVLVECFPHHFTALYRIGP